MTRVHDMGGRFGDGAIRPEPEDAPVFAEDWHARALAVTLAGGALGQWNIDISRHARERLAPKDYARFSYYEKWLAGLADLLVQQGVLTRDDLADPDAPSGHDPHPLADRALRADAVAATLAKGGPADRDGPAPSFAPGDRVRTRARAENVFVPGGHTRLPAYAQGVTGTVVLVHGCHVLPDSAAHGRGEAPEPLYAVAFGAHDLWQAPEGSGDEVVLDLWESYLERAE
ncbi:MAG: nitrile hydratase subunit beta [Marinibacterium sp.]|nr:nitrile hydratase subunit beta [Marinibacterium sp.]